MSKNLETALAVAVLTMVAGCATPYGEAPLATNFPTIKQEKLQAAAHWNVIAGDVAKQVAARLPERPALHVSQAAAASGFDRVFSNQLITALVAEGFVVRKERAGALTVEVDAQAVQFSAHRPQYRYSGAATVLTAGVWALHNATAASAAAAAVVAADTSFWFRSEFATGETPQTEIVVTTSVSDSHQYLARSTSVYYVADADAGLYQASSVPAPVVRIPVRGGE